MMLFSWRAPVRWLLRWICVLFFMKGVIAALAGFYASDGSASSTLILLVPKLAHPLQSLHPHAMQLLIGGSLLAVIAVFVGGVVLSYPLATEHGSARFAGSLPIAPPKSSSRVWAKKRPSMPVSCWGRRR